MAESDDAHARQQLAPNHAIITAHSMDDKISKNPHLRNKLQHTALRRFNHSITTHSSYPKMRSLSISLCAAALASSVSAFDICWALGCHPPSDSPAVSIPLEIEGKDGVYYPTVRIELDESDMVCDPSGVQILGQPLPIDDNGRGSGHLRVLGNYGITAKWEFSCASPKDSSTEHKLVLVIDSINRVGDPKESVPDVKIETRFRQTYPVVFTSVESKALTNNPEYSRGTLHYGPGDDWALVGFSYDL
ncbi:hypothetical protein B0T10DRAFT_501702 [Thelonectria olida]|uniref:Uncharacterized protein n=1 Tax=Thelonectria olida TaxID=1576542 RepID=A0A9P9AEA8_9HYPO|nr:hypothetical protein B0T10DRAFT_501702 [Thelonectria olida]